MQRRSTTQDISWFIDLRRNNQLDLNPPYQRKSVWNPKDRRFFLDTVFRGYPCPAIFLHKTQGENQQTIYAVVDGKQRLQTLFMFVDGELTLDEAYGDERLSGKSWNVLGQNEKQQFWNYVVPVEFLVFDENDPQEVNQAFDRLNRNMRKLEPQELRHARWDGWFIKYVEAEAESAVWRKLGVVTNARAKRMKDAQFISELLLVLIQQEQTGFDQQKLDDAYAMFDDPDEVEPPLDTSDVSERLEAAKDYLSKMQDTNSCVKDYASALAVFYTLWSAVALHRDMLGAPESFAHLYARFMAKVKELDALDPVDRASRMVERDGETYSNANNFLLASKGASTDLTPRMKRLTALLAEVEQVRRA